MKTKNKKLVYGVGLNDVDYAVVKFETISVGGKRKQKIIWICPYFKRWKNMIERCYSVKYQEKQPTYKDCTVSDEWLVFSNFKSWMEQQNWQGNHLDKDLLFEGNKVYSAEKCVFVSQMVNNFTTDSGAARGELMIGVHWHKRDKKFTAQCSNPITKKTWIPRLLYK